MTTRNESDDDREPQRSCPRRCRQCNVGRNYRTLRERQGRDRWHDRGRDRHPKRVIRAYTMRWFKRLAVFVPPRRLFGQPYVI